MYKKHWGVRIFEEWQAERENKLVMSEKNHAVQLKFETVDRKLDNLLIEYDWCELDNDVQRNIAPEQFYACCRVIISIIAQLTFRLSRNTS